MTENLLSLSLKGSSLMESTFLDLVSNCKNLRKLDLSCCNSLFMSGQLLASPQHQTRLAGVLQHVTELNLASIRFLSDETFNRMMLVCPRVERLSLAGNMIVFFADSYQNGERPSSAVLTFKNIMAWIVNQKGVLKSLNLSRTAIADEMLGNLANIPGLMLEEMHLVACKEMTNDGICSFVETQTKLKKLDISENAELGDKVMAAISSQLLELKNLNIHKSRCITDLGVAKLSKLLLLEKVNLSACYTLSSKGLTQGFCCSQSMTKLTNLNLNACCLVKDGFIIELCKSLPDLQHLDIGSCTGVTDIGLLFISKYMRRLQMLRFGWCRDITDDGLVGLQHNDLFTQVHKHAESECKCCQNRQVPKLLNLPSIHDVESSHHTQDLKQKVEEEFKDDQVPYPIYSLQCLQALDLTACSKITDVGIVQVMRFQELRILHLTMCPEITDKSLIAVASKVPSLQELYLSHCTKITDMGVVFVTEWLKRLTLLDISNCDEVTNKSLEAIYHNCKRLRHLDVSMCAGITLQCVEMLEHNMKHLHSVKKRLVGGSDNLENLCL